MMMRMMIGSEETPHMVWVNGAILQAASSASDVLVGARRSRNKCHAGIREGTWTLTVFDKWSWLKLERRSLFSFLTTTTHNSGTHKKKAG